MGNIYLIELTNGEERFYKIGITVNRYCRFYEIMKAGYKVKIVYMVMGIEYMTALSIEQTLQGFFNRYIPKVKFGGYTECFVSVNLEAFKFQFEDVSFKEVVQNLDISWR